MEIEFNLVRVIYMRSLFNNYAQRLLNFQLIELYSIIELSVAVINDEVPANEIYIKFEYLFTVEKLKKIINMHTYSALYSRIFSCIIQLANERYI